MHFKDEEMIRLTHENTELTKEMIEISQELDRLHHLNATSNDNVVSSLQQQLKAAKSELKRLNAKLKQLEHAHDSGDAGEHSGNSEKSNENIDSAVDETKPDENKKCDEIVHIHEHQTNTPADISDTTSVCSTINIATNEALEKLQDRFRRTMNEIAELTEEKQRLEHLVLQLQSETETIGEYIALYQTQRRLLKQRELEKDIQLHRIANDRSEMKEKLRQLNQLVELLLMQKGFTNAQQIMEKLNATQEVTVEERQHQQPIETTTNGDFSNVPVEHKSNENGIDDSLNESNDIKENQHCDDHNHDENMQKLAKSTNSHETAEKIINLLTEIKEKNLNQDYISVPNSIHHCPCCSGKLEIV